MAFNMKPRSEEQNPVPTQKPGPELSTPSATKNLFLSVAVLLAILAGYNVLIERSAAKSQRRQLLARLDNLPPATDCIFCGNSAVEAGCDTDAFKSAWPNQQDPPQPINIGLGATSPVEHYLILKKALPRAVRVKYVIYGFSDDQLFAPVRGNSSDLIGNRAISYYFPDEAASFYAPGSWLKKWQLRIVGRIPMLAERSSLWVKVERLRRRLEEIGMPKRKTNRFGRVDDFAALEDKDSAGFDKRCQAILRQQAGFSAPVRELIRLARQHGAQVLLVEMPMPSRHRLLFYSSPAWAEVRGYIASEARKEQATYLSASDWVPDDKDFQDTTHLTEEGARLFSVRLAAAISAMPVTAGRATVPTGIEPGTVGSISRPWQN